MLVSRTDEPVEAPALQRFYEQAWQEAARWAAARPSRPIDVRDGAAPGTMWPMLLTEIDHVAIAVLDLDASIEYYERMFGATVHHREIVESDGVEEALLKIAESYIQLSQAIREDSPIARFIEKRGEGLHHIAFRVDDIASVLQSMIDNGARAIDEKPRPGSRGTTVAFLHPKGSHGTLIELVQE